ncbi:hypothetical protein AgCh_004581 [Apium graveolens]
MANPTYIQILKNGPFIPMERIDESTDVDMVISSHFAPNDPSKYTEPEKEKIWEKIEILCEGTEEVRSNQRRIPVSRYEGVMAKPKEGITEVFERKPKKVKKDNVYLELEAKYEVILKKQQGKAYIAEGRIWDDTDEKDENEEFRNYALMALEQGESSSSKSELVGQYHEKSKPRTNIVIGLDYDALNNNKKNEGDKGKAIANQDIPLMLRKVDAPLFKAYKFNFSEVELVIKQELADEDNEKKNEENTPTVEIKKPEVNQVSKTLIKTENARKKEKKNMNGKIG